MRANPGGQIPANEVVGRDRLIKQLWEIIEQQSMVLSAERRMGKTCVIKKMQAESGSGRLTIYRDLENVRLAMPVAGGQSPLEFVELVFEDVERHLSKFQRTASKTRQFLSQFGSVEVSSFRFPQVAAAHWKTLLVSVLEDLLEHQDRRVVLFWDEVPWMLDRLGSEAATEIWDTLRSLRQTLPQLRMVFTGSIGLHHVIGGFKRSGYINDPTNDMYEMDVPPLDFPDARGLAYNLLEGEGISSHDNLFLAEAIAEAVDCIPYYIHHLVAQLKRYPGEINSSVVGEIINQGLTDPLGRWDMAHYRDRLNNYYPDESERAYALGLLDVLAFAQPLGLNDLCSRLAIALERNCDRELVLSVLQLLQRDYYLIQRGGSVSFRYDLIRRYWQLSRGIGHE